MGGVVWCHNAKTPATLPLRRRDETQRNYQQRHHEVARAPRGGKGTTLVLFTLSAYLRIDSLPEEVVFRRLIMGYLGRIMPAAASVLLSSLVCGLAHIAPVAIVSTFFADLSFALVARWHRSLWAGFILHMCNNVLVQIIVMAGI